MRALAVVALAILPSVLCAADLTEAETDSVWFEQSLSDVVVTGTRTVKPYKEVPVQTRVISGIDIRRSDATDLQDLLQTELPGVEFSYAMNQQINMNLAGFAGQSVLILVDGERMAGETMDNVDFSRLLMSGVARIEIVKGASSALYGSNAAGGVINIITKNGSRKWSANLNSRYGRHGEWRNGGMFSFTLGKVSNTLEINHHRIGTYTVCTDLSDECDFRKVHGFRSINFSDRLSYRPTANITLSARAGYYFKQRYYNPDTPDRYRDFTGGLRGTMLLGDNGNLEVSYAFDQYDKSDYLKEHHLDIRDYRNVLHTVRALYTHTLNRGWVLTGGGDFVYDYLDTYQFAQGEYKHQYTADMFSQADWTVNSHWELLGALRYDYFSDSRDSRVTGKFNARYSIGDIAVRGGYAQGFRAPSLKEKYMDFDMAGIFDIHGNPNLKPETSHNLNLSAEYEWQNYNFSLAGNYTFVNDKISTSVIRYGLGGSPYIDYINIDRLRVAGIDVIAGANWQGGLLAKLSYAFVHEQTVGGAITQYCPARPHSLNAQIGWRREWCSKYATDITLYGRFLSKVSYSSMYMYEPFETKQIVNPAYAMCKLQIGQTILDGIRVNLTLDNLLNYRPKIYSYNSPITDGINVLIGVNIDLDRIFK